MRLSQKMEGNLDQTMSTITSLSGGISFLENAALLCFLVRLLKQYKSHTEHLDFTMQIVFVCVNDTASSFILFWLGIIRVTGNGTATFCAFAVLLSVTIQTMSLCNIMCICAFRYNVAKNIRKVGAVRRSRKNVILVAVNIAVAIFGMSLFWGTLELRSIPDGTNIACYYKAVVSGKATLLLIGIGILVLIVCTVVSDVLCCMTIYRLKRDIAVVENSEVIQSVTDISMAKQRSGGNRRGMKSGQQAAITTILIVLVLFNMSLLPNVIASSIVLAGIYISPMTQRIIYLSMYFNSMFNPLIIACRFQDIRKLLRQFWVSLKERCLL